MFRYDRCREFPSTLKSGAYSQRFDIGFQKCFLTGNSHEDQAFVTRSARTRSQWSVSWQRTSAKERRASRFWTPGWDRASGWKRTPSVEDFAGSPLSPVDPLSDPSVWNYVTQYSFVPSSQALMQQDDRWRVISLVSTLSLPSFSGALAVARCLCYCMHANVRVRVCTREK